MAGGTVQSKLAQSYRRNHSLDRRSEFDGRLVPDAKSERKAVGMGRASGLDRLAERLAQKEITRFRLDRHEIIGVGGFQAAS